MALHNPCVSEKAFKQFSKTVHDALKGRPNPPGLRQFHEILIKAMGHENYHAAQAFWKQHAPAQPSAAMPSRKTLVERETEALKRRANRAVQGYFKRQRWTEHLALWQAGQDSDWNAWPYLSSAWVEALEAMCHGHTTFLTWAETSSRHLPLLKGPTGIQLFLLGNDMADGAISHSMTSNLDYRVSLLTLALWLGQWDTAAWLINQGCRMPLDWLGAFLCANRRDGVHAPRALKEALWGLATQAIEETPEARVCSFVPFKDFPKKTFESIILSWVEQALPWVNDTTKTYNYPRPQHGPDLEWLDVIASSLPTPAEQADWRTYLGQAQTIAQNVTASGWPAYAVTGPGLSDWLNWLSTAACVEPESSAHRSLVPYYQQQLQWGAARQGLRVFLTYIQKHLRSNQPLWSEAEWHQFQTALTPLFFTTTEERGGFRHHLHLSRHLLHEHVAAVLMHPDSNAVDRQRWTGLLSTPHAFEEYLQYNRFFADEPEKTVHWAHWFEWVEQIASAPVQRLRYLMSEVFFGSGPRYGAGEAFEVIQQRLLAGVRYTLPSASRADLAAALGDLSAYHEGPLIFDAILAAADAFWLPWQRLRFLCKMKQNVLALTRKRGDEAAQHREQLQGRLQALLEQWVHAGHFSPQDHPALPHFLARHAPPQLVPWLLEHGWSSTHRDRHNKTVFDLLMDADLDD